MQRSSPHVPWSDSIARELEQETARLQASIEVQARNAAESDAEKLTWLPSLSNGCSDLAGCHYVLGRSEGDVLSSLQRSLRISADYCALVRDRVKLRGDAETHRVDSSLLAESVYNALILKDDASLPRLLDGTEDVLAQGGVDCGEEFGYLLQALRLALRGEPAKAVEAMKDAAEAKKGAWRIYFGATLSKKARAPFESLAGPLNHPLGAWLANDEGAFTKTLQAMCDAFDAYGRELVAKRKVNEMTLARTLAWSKDATAFLALGRKRGWEPKVEQHYALARTLLDASPATVS